MLVSFFTFFPDFIFYETMYSTFGWWFVVPSFKTYNLMHIGNWVSLAPSSDYLTKWFFSQYALIFYYSWLAATVYLVAFIRKPSYERLVMDGMRIHNNFTAFYFVILMQYVDWAYLGSGGQDTMFALDLDMNVIKVFLMITALDMNYFMYASLLIMRHDYMEGVKEFGTVLVRNTRAKNSQLSEGVLLNTSMSVFSMGSYVYCLSPEVWGDDEPMDLWVTFIYYMPYYNPNLNHYPLIFWSSEYWPWTATYGSLSDYTPWWNWPNYSKTSHWQFMPWVEKPDSDEGWFEVEAKSSSSRPSASNLNNMTNANSKPVSKPKSK